MSTIRKKAQSVIDVMEELRKVAPHCGSNTIIAFIYVAIEPGITIGQVQKHIGLPPTATARAIGILMRRTRGEEGLNLIESRPDAIDGRVKHLHLTQRGERIWKDMQRHLEN